MAKGRGGELHFGIVDCLPGYFLPLSGSGYVKHVYLPEDRSVPFGFTVAERTAFRWDNSKRELISGMGITGQYDGLYWRMSFGNGALQSLFGWGTSFRSTRRDGNANGMKRTC